MLTRNTVFSKEEVTSGQICLLWTQFRPISPLPSAFNDINRFWARIFAQKPGDSQVSGHCGEKKHRGLAVLLGLIVKFSP